MISWYVFVYWHYNIIYNAVANTCLNPEFLFISQEQLFSKANNDVMQ